MNALERIAARYQGHAYVDYFDCLTASLEAAKSRNKRAVQARLAGDELGAARHFKMRREYMVRARAWHDLIDWSDE